MPTTADRARRAALSAFEWVAAAVVRTDDGGRAWTEDGVVDDSLYSGAVGVLLAASEAVAAGLAEETGVAACLDLARERVTALLGAGDPSVLEDDGLFSGWAGLAAALQAYARVRPDVAARTEATRATAALAARAATPSQDDNTDVIGGDAGRLLALATLGAGDPVTAAATTTAMHVVADRLLAAAEDGPDGPQWRMVPDYPILMPNFSHGTAGVAYALLLAGHRIDRADLVAAAVRGAETLLALGETAAGWALPMTVPRQAHRPAVSFGWCHGPSGTIRLFDLLTRLQPDDARWPQTVARCYTAVRTSGLPERRTPGFWDNVARCCGTAGVGTMALDRYRATGDAAVLAWADELAGDVLDRALVTPTGTCWSNLEHTATPPDLPPEPGFMQGAAGIAGWLARLAAVHDDPDHAGLDLGVTPGWV